MTCPQRNALLKATEFLISSATIIPADTTLFTGLPGQTRRIRNG